MHCVRCQKSKSSHWCKADRYYCYPIGDLEFQAMEEAVTIPIRCSHCHRLEKDHWSLGDVLYCDSFGMQEFKPMEEAVTVPVRCVHCNYPLISHTDSHYCKNFIAPEESLVKTVHPVVVEHQRGEKVNHPAHYGGDTPYEVIKVLEAWDMYDFCLCSTITYIARAEKKQSNLKGVLEDYKKAQWFLNRKIEQMERHLNRGNT